MRSCSFVSVLTFPSHGSLFRAEVGTRCTQRRRVVMMPEGPEVKTMGDHLRCVEGWSLTGVKVLSGRYQSGKPPVGMETFQETLPLFVEEVNVKGKLLYMRCEKGRGIYFTLGMTGSFGWERSANSRVGLDFDVNQTEKRTVYFNDQRNFGTVTFCLQNKTLLDKLNKIGVSFLDGLSAEQFHNLVERQKKTKSSRSLAVFLMDQTRTSGVGNYILSESLYRSRLSPWVSVGELSRGQVTELYFHIRDIMEMSYEAQREFPFARGTIHQYLQVYGRRQDPWGRTVIRAEGPHKRSIWYVPQLQQKQQS